MCCVETRTLLPSLFSLFRRWKHRRDARVANTVLAIGLLNRETTSQQTDVNYRQKRDKETDAYTGRYYYGYKSVETAAPGTTLNPTVALNPTSVTKAEQIFPLRFYNVHPVFTPFA